MMKSTKNVLDVIKKDPSMASIDLKDVFYSVPVPAHHQKYLTFFANKYLKFTCMPNGYCPTMRIFTKITIFSAQDAESYHSCIYRRFLLNSKTYESCLKYVMFYSPFLWMGFNCLTAKEPL